MKRHFVEEEIQMPKTITKTKTKAKQKHMKKTLSTIVVSGDMHIRITILYTQPNGKRLKSDTTQCWQECGIK